MQYDNMDLGQYCVRGWFVAWFTPKLYTWTNVDFSKVFGDIPLRTISQLLKISICIISFKITLLELPLHFPGACELKHWELNRHGCSLKMIFSNGFYSNDILALWFKFHVGSVIKIIVIILNRLTWSLNQNVNLDIIGLGKLLALND